MIVWSFLPSLLLVRRGRLVECWPCLTRLCRAVTATTPDRALVTSPPDQARLGVRRIAPPEVVPWGEMIVPLRAEVGHQPEVEARQKLVNDLAGAVLQGDGAAVVASAIKLLTHFGHGDSYGAYLCGAAAKELGLRCLARYYWLIGQRATNYPHCRSWCVHRKKGFEFHQSLITGNRCEIALLETVSVFEMGT